jgi:hypothetical protein
MERSGFDELMKNSGLGPARDLMDRGGHAASCIALIKLIGLIEGWIDAI